MKLLFCKALKGSRVNFLKENGYKGRKQTGLDPQFTVRCLACKTLK